MAEARLVGGQEDNTMKSKTPVCGSVHAVRLRFQVWCGKLMPPSPPQNTLTTGS